MKIAIDASALTLPITGIGRYTQQLIKQLNKIKKSKDEIIYFWGAGYKESDFIRDDIQTSKHTHRNKIKGFQTLWEQFVLPYKISKYKFDLYHTPRDKNIPYLKINNTLIFVTMHDTLVFSHRSNSISNSINKLRWHRAAKIADKIITVSNNSKKDLLEQFQFLNKEQVFVNYCGVDDKFLKKNINIKLLAKIKAKYGIKKKYFLATGSTEPVKNNKLLLEVMKLANKYFEKMFENYELIIVGPEWPGEKEPRKLAKNIKFTGYVEEEDLPVLMSGAEIFLFPSLYEGFGLPSLEAMAAETVVITSNSSSLPEVIGEAGIMLDPNSPQIWLDSIINILKNNVKRQKYINLGKKE